MALGKRGGGDVVQKEGRGDTSELIAESPDSVAGGNGDAEVPPPSMPVRAPPSPPSRFRFHPPHLCRPGCVLLDPLLIEIAPSFLGRRGTQGDCDDHAYNELHQLCRRRSYATKDLKSAMDA